MRKQQRIWQQEHIQSKALPSYLKPEPSGMVIQFMDFLKNKNIPLAGKALDIGCGKGRNSIYLAGLGFSVYALDYIQEALDYLRSEADKQNLTQNITLINGAIDASWPFPDDMFDIALDCFSSIDIEAADGRGVYLRELYRTLKPGAHALVAVVSANDEFESEMMRDHPGAEHTSVIWPANGKFQKNYDEKELREFYKNLKILELRKVTKPAEKLGRKYTATNYFCVLQK
jgi:tellurite methyltransferase